MNPQGYARVAKNKIIGKKSRSRALQVISADNKEIMSGKLENRSS